MKLNTQTKQVFHLTRNDVEDLARAVHPCTKQDDPARDPGDPTCAAYDVSQWCEGEALERAGLTWGERQAWHFVHLSARALQCCLVD